jgi:hypothetical protein
MDQSQPRHELQGLHHFQTAKAGYRCQQIDPFYFLSAGVKF